MKCPVCGAEMTLDSHRKIPLYMCYECGYIEGRNVEGHPHPSSNTHYTHLRRLDLNETAAYLAEGLKKAGVSIEEDTILKWLTEADE